MFTGIPNAFFSWLDVPTFVETEDRMEETGEHADNPNIEHYDMQSELNEKDEVTKTEKSDEKFIDNNLEKQKSDSTIQEIAAESSTNLNLEQISNNNEHTDNSSNDSQGDSIRGNDDEEFSEELEQILVTGAKSLGNFLYNTASSAMRIVSETSTIVKESIEESLIFREFNKEQESFQKENAGEKLETALPWQGCSNEETIKTACLNLSKEQRNFLHHPPPNSDFEFDYETSYPIALAIMDQDPCLATMRYELVPKKIKEKDFWKNYFYRVNLIRKDALENPVRVSPSRDHRQVIPETNEVNNSEDKTKYADLVDWVTEIDKEISNYEAESETAGSNQLEDEIENILQEINSIP